MGFCEGIERAKCGKKTGPVFAKLSLIFYSFEFL